MPQTEISESTYHARIAKAQQAMKEFGLGAIVVESGPAMQYLTGVRWGRSERTFAVVIPAKGEPVYVLPGFEEMRARELIQPRRRYSSLAGGRKSVSRDRAGIARSRRLRDASEWKSRCGFSSSTESARRRRSSIMSTRSKF